MLQRTVSSVSSMNRGTAPTESNLNTGRASTGERIGGNRDLDAASDTSSARERQFDELLGPEPTYAFTARRPVPSRTHRLHEIGVAAVAAREERLRLERDRSLMQEMAQLTQRPNITKHARERAPKRELFYDHAEKWLERKTMTRDRLAVEQEERELQEVYGSPAISQKSRDLTEDPNRHYIHPVEDWELRFSEYLAKKQFDEIEPEHIPNIGRSSGMSSTGRSFNSTHTNGDSIEAGNRLYEESITREERREALLKTLVDQELTDPVTGKRYFQPYVSEHARKIGKHRDPAAAGEDLHKQATEFQRRRQDLHQKLASAETGCTFTPAINPMSAAVSKDIRKPLFDPTWKKDRHTPREEKKDSKKLNVEQFLRRNHDGWIQTKESKLKEIRDTMKRDAMEECTFRPRISKRSQELFLSQNSSGLPSSYKSSPPRMVAASQLDPIFSQNGSGFNSKNNNNRRGGNNNNNNHHTPASQNLSGFTPSTNQRQQQQNNNNNNAAGANDDSSPEQLPSTTDVLNSVFQKPNYNDLGSRGGGSSTRGSTNNNNNSGPQSEAEREFQEAADNALRAAGLRSDTESTNTRSSRPSNFVPASSASSNNTSPSSRRTGTTTTNYTTSNTNASSPTNSSHYQPSSSRTPTAYTNVTASSNNNNSAADGKKNSLPPSVASQMRSSHGGNTSVSHYTGNNNNNNNDQSQASRGSSSVPPPSSSHHPTSATATATTNNNNNQQQDAAYSESNNNNNVPSSRYTAASTANGSQQQQPPSSYTNNNNTDSGRGTPTASSYQNTNVTASEQQQQAPSVVSRSTPNRRGGTPTNNSTIDQTPTATATASGTATNMTPSQAQQQQNGEQVGALQNQMYGLLNEWQQLENV